jgi:hypothetical protein
MLKCDILPGAQLCRLKYKPIVTSRHGCAGFFLFTFNLLGDALDPRDQIRFNLSEKVS